MPEVSHLQRQTAIGLVWLYLPTAVERTEILGTHFKLRRRDTAQFDLDALAEKCDSCTGANLKEVAQLGLRLAFSVSIELDMDHLLAAIPEVRPRRSADQVA